MLLAINGSLDRYRGACPFVILFQQDCPDQPGDGGFVGEEADDLDAALELAVEAFDGVGAVNLPGAPWGRS